MAKTSMPENSVDLAPPLLPTEQIGPKGWIRTMLFFKLDDNYDFQTFARIIETSFRSFKNRTPVAGCEAVPLQGKQAGLLKLRHYGDEIEDLKIKDLRDSFLSYSELEAQGFPIPPLEPDILCLRGTGGEWPKATDRLNVMMMQANFIRGGLILNTLILHAYADGATSYKFTEILGEEVRRAQGLPIRKPVEIPWEDRAKLMRAYHSHSDLGTPERHPEYLELPFSPQGVPPKLALPDHIGHVFYFSPEKIKALKEAASPINATNKNTSVDYLSTNDVLTALIFHCVMAAQHPEEEPVKNGVTATNGTATNGNTAANCTATTNGNKTNGTVVTNGTATNGNTVTNGNKATNGAVMNGKKATNGNKANGNRSTNGNKATNGNTSTNGAAATNGKTATNGAVTNGHTATNGATTNGNAAMNGAATNGHTATNGAAATNGNKSTNGAATNGNAATNGAAVKEAASDPPCVLGIALDARRRASVPVHKYTIGNILGFAPVIMDLPTVKRSNLADLSAIIHQTVAKAGAPYLDSITTRVQKLQDVTRLTPTMFLDMPGKNMLMSSWAEFPFYDIEWGPAFGNKIQSLRFPKPGVCHSFQIRLPDPRKGGAEVFVGALRPAMERLLADPLWTQFAVVSA